jgi:type II secretion system protein H
MPISTTAPPEIGRTRQWIPGQQKGVGGASGFTLIELALVLVIMTVVFALVVPRLRDPGRTELDAQAHRLALTFRLLRSEAVLNGNAYRLNYDLDQQRYWVTVADASVDLAQFAHDIGSLARGTKLEHPIGITDVVLPTLAGKIAQGQVYTVFYPDGSVDPTVIHLTNGREASTLWLNPMNGRLNTDPGYREVQYSE